MKNEIKILVAKPGLDGHDKGAKIVSFALQDAGMKVIYSGLHQDLDKIVDVAEENQVDAIGLSIMTGAHLLICEKLVEKLRERKMSNTKLFVGGVIPKKDIERLNSIGVHSVFPNGTKISTIVKTIQASF